METAVQHFSQMLFLERLRTCSDRQHLLELYEQCWGCHTPMNHAPELSITPSTLKLGWAAIPRAGTSAPVPTLHPGDRLQLLPSQQAVLESVLQAIGQGWMCILVGASGSGKTSIARTAAQLAGRQLTELALTGGTDTADLLGGFEQLEPKRKVQVRACHAPSCQPCHAKSCCSFHVVSGSQRFELRHQSCGRARYCADMLQHQGSSA